MAEQEREAGYHVWARRSGEQEATVRFVAQDYEHAENEAIHIARASGDEGAVSVYVADAAGRPLWAAGEKAVELRATGVRLNTWGKVLDEPVDVLMPTDQNEGENMQMQDADLTAADGTVTRVRVQAFPDHPELARLAYGLTEHERDEARRAIVAAREAPVEKE